MRWLPAIVAAPVAAVVLFAGGAHAEEQCRLVSGYSENPPTPAHLVSFVIAGVQDELVVLTIDELPVFEARLTTEDWSTGFSGSKSCLMAGRYWLNVKIGEAEGNLWFGVSEETTIFLDVLGGALSFNVWGPDAPGLE